LATGDLRRRRRAAAGDARYLAAFDDKIGAYVVAQVLREVRRRGDQQVTLVGVSTVQEEIGLRVARPVPTG